jgi:small multidrug resistance pump
MPVGVAYGVWTACGVALVAIVARFLFNDPLTTKMAIGIIFIVCGVLAIELAGVPGHGAS